METHTIFDTFNKEYISGTTKEIGKKIGVHYTDVAHLVYALQETKHRISIRNRYIRQDCLSECFTYVLLEGGKEYLCASNKSLFLLLNIPYNENETKYLNKLKNGIQLTCQINGQTFYCKEFAKLENGSLVRLKGDELRHIKAKTTLQRQIKSRILSGLYAKFKTFNCKKRAKTQNIIGCDIPFFMGWMEKQFTNGMSWDNKNEWEIDHIIPTNLFDLTNKEEQMRAFHYSNCRPLWAKDNNSRPKDGSDTLNSEIEQRVINYWRELGMNTERPLKLAI